MKIILAILLLTSSFTFNASASEMVNYKSLLIGTWGNSVDGGQTFWGYDEFQSDGILNSWGTFPGSDIKFKTKSRWTLEVSEKLIGCFTVIEASQSSGLTPGEKICQEVVSIDWKTMIFIQNGVRATVYRVKL